MEDFKVKSKEVFEKHRNRYIEKTKYGGDGAQSKIDNLNFFGSVINDYTEEIIAVGNHYLDKDSSINKDRMEKYLKDEIKRFNSLLKVE